MRNGKWKENGEAIIIDENGVIKDGQHRLLAVEATGFCYRVPVVSGVACDVMDTIDTGSNRSAGDILHLEGFKYARQIAGTSKMILLKKVTDSSSKNSMVSNADILTFAQSKKLHLEEIAKVATLISGMQVPKVLIPSVIAYYLYIYGNNKDSIGFLNKITGIVRQPKTATDYVFKKLAQSKNGDIRLSQAEKNQYIEKAYFLYSEKGNPNVRSINITKP